MRNDNGIFHDISAHAGIHGSVIGFGLGVAVGDVDNDGWPDLYVANDFYERDYLYINRHDGTFSEDLEKYMSHISMFSMGADMADINNDGYLDIFSTDMLPQDDYRLKKMTAFESYNTYQLRVRTGFTTSSCKYAATKSGRKNFMKSGKCLNVDAFRRLAGRAPISITMARKNCLSPTEFIKTLPTRISSSIWEATAKYISKNSKKNKLYCQNLSVKCLTKLKLHVSTTMIHLKTTSSRWGIDQPGFSNGSAYGDLDNDGDLDLVINNSTYLPSTYQNRLPENEKNNSISLRFKGAGKNSFGIGTKVRLYTAAGFQYWLNRCNARLSIVDGYKYLIGLIFHQR